MAVNLTPNVYAHWKLNAGSGNNCVDSGVHGRDGTRINMEDADWVAGKLNNCLLFDGTNEYVNCGNIANFERTDTFSIECWVKTIATDTEFLISKNKTTNPWNGWYLDITSGHFQFNLVHDSSGGDNIIRVETTATFNNNVWHHVICTYDGTSLANGIHIYVDNIDQPFTILLNTLTSSILSAVNCQISGRNGSNLLFTGNLDEVVVYDKELSLAEVAFRYNNGSGTEDMVSIPPTAPNNPNPNDAATGISYNQDLDWDSTGNKFDVYWGTSTPPALIESNHLTSDYVLPNLDSCTKYYWKIVAKNDWGDEVVGAEWDFTTGNEPPLTPYDNVPAHNVVNQNVNLTLTWDSEDYNPNDTVVYDIYFGTAVNPPLVKANHGSKSYTVSGLDYDKNYYWKIVAKDDATCGVHNTTSPIWRFTTKELGLGGFLSFDPRDSIRNTVGYKTTDVEEDGVIEKCITVTDNYGETLYIPIYKSERVKSEKLPTMPFIEMQIVKTYYEPHDIGAATRKMESYIDFHVYITDTDNIDREAVGKKIKDRLHDIVRSNQCNFSGITFINIENDTYLPEKTGNQLVYHYVCTFYCLWYDICT